MTRYWQDKNKVVYTRPGHSAHVETFSTEVQVVPLDAEVVTPGSGAAQQIATYGRLAHHPFFADCYDSDLSLSDAMVQKLDAAVDAIVIERADLPEPMVAFGEVKSGHVHAAETASPEWHLNTAKHHLAISKYLREHPPVDEAQVRELTAVLYRLTNAPAPDLAAAIARELIATGRVQVTP